MIKFTFSLLVAASALLVSGAAQASLLYVTNGDSARLAIVDTVTQTLVSTSQTAQGQYPIAVSSLVRLGSYYGNTASDYTLAGTSTGNDRTLTSINAVDGTTDGSFNYALNGAFSSNATVTRYNLDWSNPVNMFSFGGSSDLVGITYDTAAGSLWISSSTSIFQFSMSGTLLSQFSQSGGRGSLAYDGSTDTLWYVENGNNSIQQYSTSGTLLQTETVQGLSSNNWGAEFAIAQSATAVPEPATFTILGVGVVGVGAVRRRRAA